MNPFRHERVKYDRYSLKEFVEYILEAGSQSTISRLEHGKYPKYFYILKRYRQNGASLDKIFDSISVKKL
ncbi:MAG: hypothetical protein HUU50_02720 [Candidatus Brocadiae bacterium]|nr:hypothetical protein [Candidatus Brocadiia bacterium]